MSADPEHDPDDRGGRPAVGPVSRQTNIARDQAAVFAVQDGVMYVHDDISGLRLFPEPDQADEPGQGRDADPGPERGA